MQCWAACTLKFQIQMILWTWTFSSTFLHCLIMVWALQWADQPSKESCHRPNPLIWMFVRSEVLTAMMWCYVMWKRLTDISVECAASKTLGYFYQIAWCHIQVDNTLHGYLLFKRKKGNFKFFSWTQYKFNLNSTMKNTIKLVSKRKVNLSMCLTN
jgi:hypothetical protein